MRWYTRRCGGNREQERATTRRLALVAGSYLCLVAAGLNGTAQTPEQPHVGAVAVPVLAAPIPPLPQVTSPAGQANEPPSANSTAPPPRAEGTVSLESATSGILTPSARTSRRYFMDPFVRSGCPQTIRRLAIPSTLPNQYSAGYMGGGVPFCGEGRYTDEGTWAIDYDGILRKHVWLLWTHGRRYQGGTEGYKTDGPRLLHHD